MDDLDIYFEANEEPNQKIPSSIAIAGSIYKFTPDSLHPYCFANSNIDILAKIKKLGPYKCISIIKKKIADINQLKTIDDFARNKYCMEIYRYIDYIGLSCRYTNHLNSAFDKNIQNPLVFRILLYILWITYFKKYHFDNSWFIDMVKMYISKHSDKILIGLLPEEYDAYLHLINNIDVRPIYYIIYLKENRLWNMDIKIGRVSYVIQSNTDIDEIDL
jgi:hypothetical protein